MGIRLTLEEVLEKANLVHNFKFKYILKSCKNNRDYIIVICPEHGMFKQMIRDHLRGNGCKKCTSRYKLSQDQILQRIFEVHGDRYKYKFIKNDNLHDIMIVTCNIHGDFKQTIIKHLLGRGCPDCGINKLGKYNKLTLEEFIKRSNEIHNNRYNYPRAIYINAKTKLIITCKIHGDFEQIPDAHLRGAGCPRCKASKGELTIENILLKYNIPFETEYKLPNQKYTFEYDFYLTELNILIEFHGRQHYEPIDYFGGIDSLEENKQRDMTKRWLAIELNIPLLEFNYKQLDNLTKEQFEQLVIKNINFYNDSGNTNHHGH